MQMTICAIMLWHYHHVVFAFRSAFACVLLLVVVCTFVKPSAHHVKQRCPSACHGNVHSEVWNAQAVASRLCPTTIYVGTVSGPVLSSCCQRRIPRLQQRNIYHVNVLYLLLTEYRTTCFSDSIFWIARIRSLVDPSMLKPVSLCVLLRVTLCVNMVSMCDGKLIDWTISQIARIPMFDNCFLFAGVKNTIGAHAVVSAFRWWHGDNVICYYVICPDSLVSSHYFCPSPMFFNSSLICIMSSTIAVKYSCL